jgi:UDP-perosamine 4-acetyltransferase
MIISIASLDITPDGIAPGAHLGGTAILEEGVFLGIGSSVIPGRRIGAWTAVGAGAAVIHDLPAQVLAVGVPARVLEKS